MTEERRDEVPCEDFTYPFPNGTLSFREDHLQRYGPRLRNVLEAHLGKIPSFYIRKSANRSSSEQALVQKSPEQPSSSAPSDAWPGSFRMAGIK